MRSALQHYTRVRLKDAKEEDGEEEEGGREETAREALADRR